MFLQCGMIERRTSINQDEERIESSKETLNCKGGKSKKERKKCSYCNIGFHIETSCMVKTIDLTVKVIQKHDLADCIQYSVKKNSNKPPEDQGKVHVLTIISSSYDRWILELGASNHIITSHNCFSSLVPCTRHPLLWETKHL